VRPGGEFFRHVVVTHGAIDGFKLVLVREFYTIQFHVAVDAREIRVHRGGIRFGIYGDGYLHPPRSPTSSGSS